MYNHYFFVDGSALIGDINRLRSSDNHQKKLSIKKFVEYFVGVRFRQLHGTDYKRFTLYFAENDDRVDRYFILPDPKIPGIIDDVQIKYCGKLLAKSKQAWEWLEQNNAPQYVLDIAHRGEKAVDTQICCDALSLACHNKMDRLLLYTNDYDYVPLCEALKINGSNISLFRLQAKDVNQNLVKNCDSFSVVEESRLDMMFV